MKHDENIKIKINRLFTEKISGIMLFHLARPSDSVGAKADPLTPNRRETFDSI